MGASDCWRFPRARPIPMCGKTLVMGIVNLTPDSFSGGGAPVSTPARAAEQALAMLEAGADIVDFGAESTRPGADPLAAGAEIDRLGDVVGRVRARADAPLSVDTRHAAAAAHVLDQGADIINDVSALCVDWDGGAGNDDLASLVAHSGAHVILSHALAPPQRMQDDPRYGDVFGEVAAFLFGRARFAERAGISRERIWLDPGFGFGKNFDHNRELLLRLPELAERGFPVVAGLSRKRMIFDALRLPVGERLEASLALAVIAAMNGAAMIRAHDVRETVRAVGMADAIRHRAGFVRQPAATL